MDAELVRKGIELTVVGLSTAFGLLLALMVMMWALGLAVDFQIRWTSRRVEAASKARETAARERALAAVIAVGALLGAHSDADSEAIAP